MKTLEHRLESQLHFWSLLGPFLILLASAVLLIKLSVHWYFPLGALAGLLLCVKWKMRGMAAALVILFSLASFTYFQIDITDRYWHVGMALALAFSLIILTLALEESSDLIERLQNESQSRLDNFLRLDETMACAEREWSAERGLLTSQLAQSIKETTKALDDKQTFYKLAQLNQDALVQVRAQHDLLLQDLVYKKQQIAQLHEKLEETELTLQELVDAEPQKQIQHLTEQLAQSDYHRNQLKLQISALENQLTAVEEQSEQKKNNLKIQLEQYTAEAERLQQVIQQIQSEQRVWQARYTVAEKEKEQLQNDLIVARKQADQLQQNAHNQQLFQHQIEQMVQQQQQALAETTNWQKRHEELTEQLTRERAENQTVCAQYTQKIVECDQLRHALDEHQRLGLLKEAGLPKMPFSALSPRRLEDLYAQLRQQFEAKTDVLAETRRELFRAQEEILRLQKEQEELSVFGRSENEMLLERELCRCVQECEECRRENESELQHLHTLVSTLIKR